MQRVVRSRSLGDRGVGVRGLNADERDDIAAPRTATNAVMPSSFATAVSWSSAHFPQGCLGRFATTVA